MKTTFNLMLAGLALVAFGRSLAANTVPGTISDDEIKRLPPYCAASMKAPVGSSNYRFWQDKIGENFAELAYYCHGLNALFRYSGARSAIERNHHLKLAKTYFDEMIAAEKPGFTLRAELYAMRGEVLRLMGNTAEAIREFNTSIEADPKNARVYVQLAEVYISAKDKKRALETVTHGLRHNPESKALRRRYLEHGGKEPFPQPVPELSAKPKEAKATEAAPPPEQAQLRSPSAGEDRQTRATEARTTEPPPVPEAGPPIGNSRNPYCRFCPPE